MNKGRPKKKLTEIETLILNIKQKENIVIEQYFQEAKNKNIDIKGFEKISRSHKANSGRALNSLIQYYNNKIKESSDKNSSIILELKEYKKAIEEKNELIKELEDKNNKLSLSKDKIQNFDCHKRFGLFVNLTKMFLLKFKITRTFINEGEKHKKTYECHTEKIILSFYAFLFGIMMGYVYSFIMNKQIIQYNQVYIEPKKLKNYLNSDISDKDMEKIYNSKFNLKDGSNE